MCVRVNTASTATIKNKCDMIHSHKNAITIFWMTISFHTTNANLLKLVKTVSLVKIMQAKRFATDGLTMNHYHHGLYLNRIIEVSD